MKTKRLNRGLALGAALLVGVGGYILYDHISFKSNKSDIETAVNDYLNAAAQASISADGNCADAWKKAVDEGWGYNSFFEKSFLSYYTTASDLRDAIDYYRTEKDINKGHLTKCTAQVDEIKISKAGPNLALATVTFSIEFEGVGQAYFLGIRDTANVIYESDNFWDVTNVDYGDNVPAFDSLEYTGSVEYDECSFYLELDGADWKIVGIDGYQHSFQLHDENGDRLSLEAVLSKADRNTAEQPGQAEDNDDSTPEQADPALEENGGEGNV